MRSHIKKFIARTPGELKKEFFSFFSKNTQKRILFDHLHKCGGSSLNKYLETHYLRRKIFSTNGRKPEMSIEEFKSFPESKRHSYELVKGHLANQLIDYIHPQHLKITVLRNPVDRIASLYYYAKESPKHYLFHKINDSEMSLEDFSASNASNEIINRYTTHFSGYTLADAKTNPEDALNEALNTLKKYNVIGILDNFLPFTDTLRLQAGLKHKYQNKKVNVTRKRATLDEIQPSTVKKIEEINYLDIALYNKIKESLNK